MKKICALCSLSLLFLAAFLEAQDKMPDRFRKDSDSGIYYQAYSGEYFSNRSNRASADLVTVTGQQTVSEIDFSLNPGSGGIDGYVTTESTGLPLPNVRIQVYGDFGEEWFTFWSLADTDSTGYYLITGLPAFNSYTVVALPDYSSLNYSREYYRNKTAATADPVSVANGQITHGINFDLPKGGIITGRVIRAGTGNPLAEKYLYASDSSGAGFGWDISETDGSYWISGLIPGDYRVYVLHDASSDDVTLYYNQKLGYTLADLVHVSAGDTPPASQQNINFSIPVGGSISGHVVVSGNGSECKEWYVSAVKNDNSYYSQSGVTEQDGSYRIPALPGGDYTVTANSFYYAQSTGVHVTAPYDTPDIDFFVCDSPFATGSIEGRVTDQQSGAGIGGLQIHTDSISGSLDPPDTCTDSNGYYAVCDVESGLYIVRVLAPETRWVAEYYNNQIEETDATEITVNEGQTVSSVNFSLLQGAVIEGRVYDERYGIPLPYYPVSIDYQTNTPGQRITVSTDGAGYYRCLFLESGGLPPRSYYVRANHYSVGFSSGEATPTPDTTPGNSTPTPNDTPDPPTPTPGTCQSTGITIWMPFKHYVPGVSCSCQVEVCNASGSVLTGYPLFVILDVYGSYYFAPGFSTNPDDYRSVHPYLPQGSTVVGVLPSFTWPEHAGSGAVTWYAGITDPGMTHLVGDYDVFEFSWNE